MNILGNEWHYMLDLETMGRSPDGAIASIGCIKFNKDELRDPFYLVVRLNGQEKLGRTFTPQTIVWWLAQSDKARGELLHADVSLEDALRQFQEYAKEPYPCWANGATFDHVILQSAYEACGLRNPIGYRQQLCMRPIRRMTTIERPNVGEAHNALDDATAQAKWMQLINASQH